jgi:pimeloyl-ACP methyl ester carboxylesterase
MKTRRFKGAGLTLNCLDYGGEGNPPMLFLHGGSAHGHWWDFTAPAFTDSFHALALDQRGHGDSEWSSEWAYGSRHYVEDLERVIGVWGLGPPVVIGHSMGGHNTLLYAASNPNAVRALVVVDSPADYSQRAVDFLQSIAEKPAPKYSSLDEACAKFRLLPRETRATAEILQHLARFTFIQAEDGSWSHKLDRRTMIREPINISPQLGKITCPALVVKLSDSFALDREVARRMAAAMPRGQMVEISNSYHHVMLDNPLGFTATLREFLRAL